MNSLLCWDGAGGDWGVGAMRIGCAAWVILAVTDRTGGESGVVARWVRVDVVVYISPSTETSVVVH